MPSPDPDTALAAFDRPARRWRIVLVALILLLHAGFFLLLENGLLQRVLPGTTSSIVTAVIFPPELPPAAAPAPAAPAPRQRKPPIVKPKPPAVKPALPLFKPVPPVVAPERSIPDAPPAPPAPTSRPATPPAETAPAPLPAPAQAPATPKTINSGAQYLQPPQPDYPAQSKRLGEEGRVILRVLLDDGGRVGQVILQKSSGFPRLDEAAIEAVRRAQFRPHIEDGKPVAVYVTVPISFRLDQ